LAKLSGAMPDTLQVHLGDRSYPIHLGGDLTADVRTLGASLRRSSRKMAVITDSNVARTQAAALQSMFGDAPMHFFSPGEESKTMAELARALDFLASQGIDRLGSVFAVGGGVVGDLAGFAAASYLRGIDYYQVPTTLLAMVDSSVGGKTGVNLKAGKNLAGAFHQPRGVFISTGLLATLPPREFAAGMAEVIKTALLEEGPLFADLERGTLTTKDPRVAQVVRLCCAIKARVVEADERELARDYGRALLNLGHTFAHAVERVAGYGSYLHGEAVAVGLCGAARLSRSLGMISESDVGRVESTVAAHGLPTRLFAPLPLGDLMAAMSQDKKMRAGVTRFVVLKSLGQAVVRADVPAEAVKAVWLELGAA
jgi:3-dehydroquinate synthase